MVPRSTCAAVTGIVGAWRWVLCSGVALPEHAEMRRVAASAPERAMPENPSDCGDLNAAAIDSPLTVPRLAAGHTRGCRFGRPHQRLSRAGQAAVEQGDVRSLE